METRGSRLSTRARPQGSSSRPIRRSSSNWSRRRWPRAFHPPCLHSTARASSDPARRRPRPCDRASADSRCALRQREASRCRARRSALQRQHAPAVSAQQGLDSASVADRTSASTRLESRTPSSRSPVVTGELRQGRERGSTLSSLFPPRGPERRGFVCRCFFVMPAPGSRRARVEEPGSADTQSEDRLPSRQSPKTARALHTRRRAAPRDRSDDDACSR